MIFISKLLILINLLSAIFLFVFKSRQNSPFQFFYLTLAAIVIWPSLFQALDQSIDFHPFAAPVYLDALGFVKINLLICGYLVVFMALELLVPLKKIELGSFSDNSQTVIYIPFALLIIALLYSIYSFGLSNLASSNFDDLRFGKVSGIYLLISYLTTLSVFLPAYLLYFKKKYIHAIFCLGLIALVYLVIGGSRQSIVISAFLVAYFPLRKLKHSNFWIVLIFLVGFGLADYVLMLIKMLRNVSDFQERVIVISQALTGSIDLSGTSSESTIRSVFYSIVVDPIDSSFRQFSYLGRTLLFWMPSSIDFLGIKPADFEADMFAYIMGGREGTMHATYFGSTFADAGFLFPIWCLLSFILMRLAERAIHKSSEPFFLWGLGIYYSVMTARGALYAVVVVFFIGIIISRVDFNFKRLRVRLS